MFYLLTGLALGAPWALSFAPFEVWWLGILLLVALQELALQARNARQAAGAGFGFGWAAFSVGVHWLYTSLHHYGGLPNWLAVLAVVFFAAYLALFPAMACGVFQWWHRRVIGLRPSPVLSAAAWSAAWTFFEWLRGTLFTGFAWLNLGDALVDSPVANLLPWLGNYGSLFLVLWLVLAGFNTVRSWFSGQPFAYKPALQVLGICSLLIAGLTVAVPVESAGVLKVAGVQTNVDQSIKFDPDRIIGNMQQAFKLGDVAREKLTNGGALLFPETVNPLVWTDTPDVWQQRFRDFGVPGKIDVVMGSAIQEGRDYYNSIVVFNGAERDRDLIIPQRRHDKRHLVPFGEFIPTGFGWFVAMLNMPMGEFSRGRGALEPLTIAGQSVAGTVCYEDIFSGEFASLLRDANREPTVLLNLSNLAWFGQSWALDQHAQMGRTRSAEHRKPGLRVTNTGLSGIVDDHGRWVLKVAPGQAMVWDGELQGRTGKTLFSRLGAFLWFGIWGAVLALMVLRDRRSKAYNSGIPI
ncbi:apolipoprotein N-acyltransferase [Limnobacter humi]|uniref:Apolipoprotein N-acyltransferase n=1 Tax=Limnobacter humi TaxID=1778671 RepID=A0ABT1WBG8_9BURK|nr:apolipoprotein N-acyltransferase [Limnobacter humi]MCQ8894858.1 apolipoprotein N-acyltransferase [Limnobacter humi]